MPFLKGRKLNEHPGSHSDNFVNFFLSQISIMCVEKRNIFNLLKCISTDFFKLNDHFVSLLNYVPCVLKTCSLAKVPCVLTCSRAHVPKCLACLRAHVPCVLMCSRANMPCMLTWQRPSFDVTIFSFAAILAEVAHTVDKVSEFNYCFSSVT